MTGRRRWAAGVLLAAVALLAVSIEAALPAAADEVTGVEFRERVRRAIADPADVDELRRVESVDGQPVDLDRALSGATGAELRARLQVLDPGPAGAGGGAGAVTSGEARAEAERILEGRRFQPSRVPRPFRGILRTLGRWLRPLTNPIDRAWDDVSGSKPLVVAVCLAVIGLAVVVSIRIARRRSSAGVARARRAGAGGRHDDPDELEGRAADAERSGDLDLALRLRFRAGLLRLDHAGVVADRPALTTGVLTRQVPSPVLRQLSIAFEEVAYGGRPATDDDVAAARHGWPRVLEEVRR